MVANWRTLLQKRTMICFKLSKQKWLDSDLDFSVLDDLEIVSFMIHSCNETLVTEESY